jgi:hypothetical protein
MVLSLAVDRPPPFDGVARMRRSVMVLGVCLLPALASAAAPAGRGSISAGSQVAEGGEAGLSVAPAAPGEGNEAYIVGGVTVGNDEYQSVVFLEMSGASGAEGTCTGSLIHKYWVLTAAHCIDSSDITSVNVSFGNRIGGFSKTVIGTEFYSHPDWPGTLNAELGAGFQGDVALIKLNEPVEDVTPMAVNRQEVDSDWLDDPITFIGFGITEHQGGGSGIKRLAEVTIGGLTSYSITMPAGPRSTCQGDSGGPGVKIVGGGYAQVGITSNGRDCGDGSSEAMRVDAYMDWIMENMAPDKPTFGFAADPSFRCSNELEAGDADTIALGVVPLTLKCVVDFYLADKVTKTEWRWGDGSASDVLEAPTDPLKVEHTYDTIGTYNVEMCVSYDRPTGEGDATESARACVRRRGYALACDKPTPEFSYHPVDSRVLAFDNYTDLKTERCIYEIAWEIFEGESATGTPIDTVESWQPVYEFPDNGTYTVVLNIGGIGGTAASELTVNVGKATRGAACDNGGYAGLLPLLGLLALRRRKS